MGLGWSDVRSLNQFWAIAMGFRADRRYLIAESYKFAEFHVWGRDYETYPFCFG